MNPADQFSLFERGNPNRMEPPVTSYVPDPDKVRSRLHKIIGEAREAEAMPWDRAKLSMYRTIVPNMTKWLPDDEAAQLRAEFAAEMDRLDPPPACPECVGA